MAELRRGARVTLIPGDGIGPKVTAAAVRILEAAGFRPKWERQLAGESAVRDLGTPLPDGLIQSISRTGVALKGPLRPPYSTGCTFTMDS